MFGVSQPCVSFWENGSGKTPQYVTDYIRKAARGTHTTADGKE